MPDGEVRSEQALVMSLRGAALGGSTEFPPLLLLYALQCLPTTSLTRLYRCSIADACKVPSVGVGGVGEDHRDV